MRKCLLGVFSVGFLASIAQGGAYTMARPITITPTPLFAGQQATIKAGPNMNVVVELDPPGTQVRLKTDANGEVAYTPANAGSLYVSDPAGNWSPASAVVQP
jgi:hypothetical protein